MIPISSIQTNPNNPRKITAAQVEKLKKSISEFSAMMELRPIIIDEQRIVLGGNMRLLSLIQLGYTEIPESWVKQAADLTEEEKQRFIIADNVGFGEWDWDAIANGWEVVDLEAWGLDIPQFKAPDVDYSILDDDDVTQQLEDMTDGVKKAIQIEFEAEHYEEAFALVKYWRGMKAYVGGMIMEYLKAEKDKL